MLDRGGGMPGMPLSPSGGDVRSKHERFEHRSGGKSGSEAAIREALARAGDGKPLDRPKAETLLHASGDHLKTLLGYAKRHKGRRSRSSRASRGHHLLQEGVHPADPPLPGPLRLLHLRDRPRAARKPLPRSG